MTSTRTPFARNGERAISELGEIKLLRQIRDWLGETAPAAPFGMGDDTAVLPGTPRHLYTSDSLVYGRHWDDTVAPEEAGAKLLKRNLSDIAAMGGIAREAVMAGFLPPQTHLDWLEAFTRGIADCAARWKVPVVGGDLTQTEEFLGFNLTLLGEMESGCEPLLRTGAAVGDRIWVSGKLGGSIRRHHFAFTPRLKEGQWLARRGRSAIHALIDVTDGLAKDLPTLLPEGTAAALDLERIPVTKEAEAVAQNSGNTAIFHALTDGEDYELLFVTAANVDEADFAAEWAKAFATPLSCLGEIVVAPKGGERALLNAKTGEPLKLTQGYEHFGRT
jgi:thiamine-monophosphate kinase